MAAALRLCPELVAILGGDLICGYMIRFGVNRRYGIWIEYLHRSVVHVVTNLYKG